MKLFVAAELPADTIAALIGRQPPAAAGIRLPAADQIHLTLHYIGESDLERIAGALAPVRISPFSLKLEGVGRFESQDGATTLWAGVTMNDELRSLHGAVAAALAPVGFRPEARPYTPHITLARCGPGSDSRIAEGVLATHAGWSLDSVRITSFGLYSTAFVANAPVYRRERQVLLQPT
jgi:RNA 2',3'-cyclic 3'-phosphodiesterase